MEVPLRIVVVQRSIQHANDGHGNNGEQAANLSARTYTSAVSGHAQEGQNSPYHLELWLRIARGDPCNGGDARSPSVFGYLFTRQ